MAFELEKASLVNPRFNSLIVKLRRAGERDDLDDDRSRTGSVDESVNDEEIQLLKHNSAFVANEVRVPRHIDNIVVEDVSPMSKFW